MLNDPDMRHGFQIISTCKSFRLEARYVRMHELVSFQFACIGVITMHMILALSCIIVPTLKKIFILFNLKNGVINRENIRQFGSLIQKQLASGGAYYLIVSLTP